MPGPEFSHRDQHAACVVFLGPDRQLSRTILYRGHRFNHAQDQVQHDLLELYTIALNRSPAGHEIGAD
jgi:hypothetical protein